jgi:hypothetical protein
MLILPFWIKTIIILFFQKPWNFYLTKYIFYPKTITFKKFRIIDKIL